MNTYATRANRALNEQVNGGAAPKPWAPLKEALRRIQAEKAAPPADDEEMRMAVKSALLHHLQTRGVEWVLDVIADAITNHAVRRLDTDDANRLQQYNLLRGYADRIGRLPERAEELINP
jgi:hypothetical protein